MCKGRRYHLPLPNLADFVSLLLVSTSVLDTTVSTNWQTEDRAVGSALFVGTNTGWVDVLENLIL